jgi:hypothetical protein
MKQSLTIILVSLLTSLLTSCGTRPYFAIENKSDNEIKIELIFDTATLNLKNIVTQYIFERKTNTSYNCIGNPECDSIRKSLFINENKTLIYNYVYDSLPIKSLFISNDIYSSYQFEEYQINPIDLSEKDFDSGKLNVNFNQTLLDYYRYDSSLVKKVISEHTLTLFLPANNMFAKQCHASGDASCYVDDAFPNVKEVRIVISKDNVITLTKQNFKLITQNKKIHGRSNSYSFEIE